MVWSISFYFIKKVLIKKEKNTQYDVASKLRSIFGFICDLPAMNDADEFENNFMEI